MAAYGLSRVCRSIQSFPLYKLSELSGKNFTGFYRAVSNDTVKAENTSAEKYQTDSEAKCESNNEPQIPEKEKQLIEKNKELSEKFEDVTDKYKRALAENENIRQRMRRQIDETKQFAIQGFCKDLLDVADVLSKATESVPKEEISGNNKHLKSLYEGLLMTDGQLQKVFENHGLVKINPIGEKFNPNFHEALFEQEIEGKDPGTVAVVTKIGYCLRERTIRPALVGVVKK